ncbi:MAG: helix-turn-helix domain-containing protein [Elusimicrobia bacterium]|nr:helix-turn-helix domain-containing protein [Elusimicrobiota bacterium]
MSIGNTPLPLLRVDEVSVWLRVKASTIRKWVCYERIPYVKVGRTVAFRREDVDAWVREQSPDFNNRKHDQDTQ